MALRDFRSVVGHAAAGLGVVRTPAMTAAITSTAMKAVATTTAPAPTLTPGECSADGQFIWRGATATVPAHWERLRVGEQCQGLSTVQPNVRVHTLVQPGPYTWLQLQSIYDQFRIKSRARMATAYAAAASELPPCDPSSQKTLPMKRWDHQTNQRLPNDGDTVVCYNGDYFGYAPIDRKYSEEPFWTNGNIPPPGGFVRVGVLFNVTDVLPGGSQFDKWYTPDETQRFLADYAIAWRSHKVLLDDDDGKRLFGPGLSINQYSHNHPDFRYQLDNYTLNPIAPTDDELNGHDGFPRWIARGGYPLSDSIAHGRQSLFGDEVLYVSASDYCQCTDGTPSSIHGHIAIDGIRQGPAETTWAKWQEFIDIGTPGKIHLWIAHQDASWFDQLGEWIGKHVEDFFAMACSTKGKAFLGKQAGASTADASTLAIAAWCYDVNKILSDQAAAQAASQLTFIPVQTTPSTPTSPTPQPVPQPVPQPTTQPVPVTPPGPNVPMPTHDYTGCVARFSQKRQLWEVYCPPGRGLGALEPAPQGMEFRIELPAKPPEAIDGGPADLPFYKEWWFWAIVGGVALTGGVGSYAIVRRRRRRKAAAVPTAPAAR